MTDRKQIMVSLSKNDLEKFDDIVKYLRKQYIYPSDSEVMKVALRGYHENIKKELGEALDEHSP